MTDQGKKTSITKKGILALNKLKPVYPTPKTRKNSSKHCIINTEEEMKKFQNQMCAPTENSLFFTKADFQIKSILGGFLENIGEEDKPSCAVNDKLKRLFDYTQIKAEENNNENNNNLITIEKTSGTILPSSSIGFGNLLHLTNYNNGFSVNNTAINNHNNKNNSNIHGSGMPIMAGSLAFNSKKAKIQSSKLLAKVQPEKLLSNDNNNTTNNNEVQLTSKSSFKFKKSNFAQKSSGRNLITVNDQPIHDGSYKETNHYLLGSSSNDYLSVDYNHPKVKFHNSSINVHKDSTLKPPSYKLSRKRKVIQSHKFLKKVTIDLNGVNENKKTYDSKKKSVSSFSKYFKSETKSPKKMKSSKTIHKSPSLFNGLYEQSSAFNSEADFIKGYHHANTFSKKNSFKKALSLIEENANNNNTLSSPRDIMNLSGLTMQNKKELNYIKSELKNKLVMKNTSEEREDSEFSEREDLLSMPKEKERNGAKDGVVWDVIINANNTSNALNHTKEDDSKCELFKEDGNTSSNIKKSKQKSNLSSVSAHNNDGSNTNDVKTLKHMQSEKNHKDNNSKQQLFSKHTNNFSIHRKLTVKGSVYDSLDDEEYDDQIEDTFYIDHEGTFVFILDVLIFIGLLISGFEIPFRLAHDLDLGCRHSHFLNFHTCFQTLFDCILIIDLIIGFFKSYQTFEEERVIELSRICKEYLTSWFFGDLISAIPFHIILRLTSEQCGVFVPKYYNSGNKHPRYILLLLRLFKLIKVFSYNRFFDAARKFLMQFNHFSNWFKLYSILIIFGLCLHIMACLFIFAGQTSYFSWIQRAGLEFESFWKIYLTGIYFIITTVTSVGYGDVTSVNRTELSIGIFLLAIGSSAYSSMLNFIESLIKRNDDKTYDYIKNCQLLEKIRMTHHMSSELYSKIYRLLKYRMMYEKKDKNIIIDSLPLGLRNRLIYEMYKPIIQNFIFFKHFDNKEFIVRVLLSFCPILAVKGDILVNEGDYIQEVIFVKSGSLSLEIPIKEPTPTVNNMKTNTSINNPTKNYFMLYSKTNLGVKRNTSFSSRNVTMNFDHSATVCERGNIEKKNNVIEYVKILEIRKNEHFGDILMFLNKRSPLTVKVKTKLTELFYLEKTDAIEIATQYPIIWRKIIKKSLFNMEQIERLINKVIKIYKTVYESNIHNTHNQIGKIQDIHHYNTKNFRLGLGSSIVNQSNIPVNGMSVKNKKVSYLNMKSTNTIIGSSNYKPLDTKIGVTLVGEESFELRSIPSSLESSADRNEINRGDADNDALKYKNDDDSSNFSREDNGTTTNNETGIKCFNGNKETHSIIIEESDYKGSEDVSIKTDIKQNIRREESNSIMNEESIAGFSSTIKGGVAGSFISGGLVSHSKNFLSKTKGLVSLAKAEKSGSFNDTRYTIKTNLESKHMIDGNSNNNINNNVSNCNEDCSVQGNQNSKLGCTNHTEKINVNSLSPPFTYSEINEEFYPNELNEDKEPLFKINQTSLDKEKGVVGNLWLTNETSEKSNLLRDSNGKRDSYDYGDFKTRKMSNNEFDEYILKSGSPVHNYLNLSHNLKQDFLSSRPRPSFNDLSVCSTTISMSFSSLYSNLNELSNFSYASNEPLQQRVKNIIFSDNTNILADSTRNLPQEFESPKHNRNNTGTSMIAQISKNAGSNLFHHPIGQRTSSNSGFGAYLLTNNNSNANNPYCGGSSPFAHIKKSRSITAEDYEGFNFMMDRRNTNHVGGKNMQRKRSSVLQNQYRTKEMFGNLQSSTSCGRIKAAPTITSKKLDLLDLISKNISNNNIALNNPTLFYADYFQKVMDNENTLKSEQNLYQRLLNTEKILKDIEKNNDRGNTSFSRDGSRKNSRIGSSKYGSRISNNIKNTKLSNLIPDELKEDKT